VPGISEQFHQVLARQRPGAQHRCARQGTEFARHLERARADLRRLAELIDEFDLARFVDRPYGELSAGQRTRVSLAKALMNRPEVLLLDEPTASLDPDVGDRMRSYLEDYQRASGCTMLLASHNMGEVERLCDDVIMLRAGTVVDQGAPRALIERYGRETMEEVFLDVARGTAADRDAAIEPGAALS